MYLSFFSKYGLLLDFLRFPPIGAFSVVACVIWSYEASAVVAVVAAVEATAASDSIIVVSSAFICDSFFFGINYYLNKFISYGSMKVDGKKSY
jgi:hypothetical protein